MRDQEGRDPHNTAAAGASLVADDGTVVIADTSHTVTDGTVGGRVDDAVDEAGDAVTSTAGTPRIAGDASEPLKNIVLIGLMGVGKTTTGIQLAKKLDRPFVDTDDHIEASAGMSIAEIFEREGESGFRKREHEIVKEVASQYGQVIAVGGGTATFTKNTELLRATGHVIWLNTEPTVLLTRLGSRVARAHRPLISQARSASELLDTLSELQAERQDSYREAAHYEVYVGNKESRSAIIRQILLLTDNL